MKAALRVFIIASLLVAFGVQSSSAQVGVQLPDTSAQVGETLTLPVQIDGVDGKDITSYEFTLPFDSTVVKITGAHADSAITPSAPTVNATSTEIKVSFASAQALSGGGTLLHLEAEVVGKGSATLQFSDFQLFDSSANVVASETTSGTVTVGGGGGVPAVPSNVSATVGDGRIHLAWNPGGEGPSGAGYNVYRSTSSFSEVSNATKANASLISDTSYTDTGLRNGTTYYYRVTAVDSAGNESGPSSEISAMPQSIVLSDGLVAYYPFSGNANDESGNGYDGTVSGASLTADRFGNGQSAYDFDGQDDYISLGDASTILSGSSFSLSLWVKIDAATDGENTQILSNESYYEDYGDFTLNSEGYRFYTGNNIFSTLSLADSVKNGRWHHVALIHDGKNGSLFVDGRKVDDSSLDSFSPSSGDLHVGASIADRYAPIDGSIDEVRLYDRALSEAEIRELSGGSDSFFPRSPADLAAITGDQSVSLSWSSGSDSTNPSGYNVYRDTSSFSDVADATKINASLISDTSYTDTGLTNGTTYYYRVTAVDSAGNESGPSSQVSATPQGRSEIFSDDFSGALTDKWVPFGNPQGRIVQDAGNPSPAFDNNGDPNWSSGAYTKKTFDYGDGLVVATDMYVPSAPDGCWVSGTFGFPRATEVGERYGASIRMKYGYAGSLCNSNKKGNLEVRVITSDGTFETKSWTEFGRYLGEWHRFKIVIRPDRHVAFYVDGERMYVTEGKASLDYTGLPLVLGNRSSSYGKVYHDNVVVRKPSGTVPPTALSASAGDQSVDLTWSPGGSSAPSGYNVYRDTSSFSDVADATKANASLISDTSYTDTGLTNGTTYYYRVTAVESPGNESGLSGEATVTPRDRKAPSVPARLTATASADSVSLDWAASDSADVATYRIYRETAPIDSAAGPSGLTPLDSVGADTTSYADTSGTPGTKYHYRVTATDEAGNESGFSEEATATPNDVTPPSVPSGLTAEAGNRQISLDWMENTEDDLVGYRLYRSAGEAPDTTEAPLSENLLAEAAYTDTSVTTDQTYRYGVTAVDTAGNESALSAVASAYLPPEQVEASVSRSFGDASGPGDYRLVALPGAPDTSLAAAVPGEPGSEWRAYWDEGSSFVRYDSSETFTFRKGRGFWLVSRQDWTVENSIQAVSLQDSTTAIPLNDGWTIVANPFGEAVSWSALQAANGGDLQALWPFGGAFSDTSRAFGSAAGGRAYYLYNGDSGRDSLQIPHPALTEEKAGKRASKTTKTGAERYLSLSATPAEAKDPFSTVQVGLTEEEAEGEALIAPPGGLEAVSLRIKAETGGATAPKSAKKGKAAFTTALGERVTPSAIRLPDQAAGENSSKPTSPASLKSVSKGTASEGSASNEEARLLMADRRKAEHGGVVFALRLRSRVDGPIQLTARDFGAVAGREVALLRPEAGRTHDLRAEKAVTIEPEGGTSVLKLAIGTDSFVKEKRQEILPEKLRLTSYPNPVRRQGTIEYALPEEKEVTLRVYDVLGRRVATLASGQKEAGRHTVTLKTGRLSSGVYFGRLQAGGQSRTLKITVVR